MEEHSVFTQKIIDDYYIRWNTETKYYQIEKQISEPPFTRLEVLEKGSYKTEGERILILGKWIEKLKGHSSGNPETSIQRAKRIANQYNIDISEITLSELCGEYWSFMIHPQKKLLLLCRPYIESIDDEKVAFYLSHEISHLETKDEGKATIMAIKKLRDKMPTKKLKELVAEWYEDWAQRRESHTENYNIILKWLQEHHSSTPEGKKFTQLAREMEK